MIGRLYLLRRIAPSPALYERLAELNQIYEFEDGTTWVDDDHPRDPEYTDEIVTGPGVTLGWGIFDADLKLLGTYKSLDRAIKAYEQARPVLITDVDLETEDEPEE